MEIKSNFLNNYSSVFLILQIPVDTNIIADVSITINHVVILTSVLGFVVSVVFVESSIVSNDTSPIASSLESLPVVESLLDSSSVLTGSVSTVRLYLNVMILCVKVSIYFYNYKENEKIQMNIIKNNVNLDEESNKYNIDFESLLKENSDTVAYIKVNNTNIDYTVVRGKDNEYYLKHNFNKKRNIAGWIFSDYRNKFDGTDKNIVIFGHNIHGDSMFEPLKNTLKKEWQDNLENRNITLITEDYIYTYEVFSTYTIPVETYYINTIFDNDEKFSKFLNTIKKRSNYDYNVDVTSSDQILTLSACYKNNKRVVLHAKKIEEKSLKS